MTLRKFKSEVRFWRPERKGGLAIAEVPAEHIAALGGLRQMRVRGRVNGAEFTSNVWPAGSGRLALSVSKAMMTAGRFAVGDVAVFEVENLPKP
jgi:hypothetical protein